MIRVIYTAVGAGILATSAWSQELPDFVPVPQYGNVSGPVGFCERPDPGVSLETKVSNKGRGEAAANVMIFYNPGGPTFTNTGPVKPGNTSAALTPIPAVCWNPDGDYSIWIDPMNDVQEVSEDNNSADG